MFNIFAVFIGGGIGATLRYLTTATAQKFWGSSLLGTFSVNIIGCFLIGLVLSITMQKTTLLPPQAKLFITVGILGGLTTFSTFSCETFSLLKDGKITQSIFYISASILLGLFATGIGYILGKGIKF